MSNYFERLPDEILLKIFSYVDLRSLGRLSSTCPRFNHLIETDDLGWCPQTPHLLGSNLETAYMKSRSRPMLTIKERCKVGVNWKTGNCHQSIVFSYRRSMPWVILDQDYVFFSKEQNTIRLGRTSNGSCTTQDRAVTSNHASDVTKFVINGDEIISGGRDGDVVRRKKDDFTLISRTSCYPKNVQAIDAKKNIMVTGGRDGCIKAWRIQDEEVVYQDAITADIPILCLAIMPSCRTFVCGLPGMDADDAIMLFDFERLELITGIGKYFKDGAGVIDLFPVNDQLFYGCGYDSTVQLFDVRTPLDCVAKWVEPFDNSLYCVKSDCNITILAGACRNGYVHLWDKRSPRLVQMYVIREYNSPVYSISFDASHCFAALDRAIVELSFLG